MRFKDQVVVVTGGARGIGAETATLFAQEGAHVVLFDVQEGTLAETAEQLRSYGQQVNTFVVDVTNQFQVRQAFYTIYEQFQRIDVLVNCAGVLQDNLLPNLKEEEWDFVIDVNLKGSYLLAQGVQRYMEKQGHGRIVFISSQAALGAKGRSNYAASKAGVLGLTRSLAIELGPQNITVNAVAPGFIDTEMSVVSAQAAQKRGIEDFEKVKQGFIATNPIRRTGKPSDIANAIVFFALEQSSYVTGQTLYVTGAP